jgi:hemerythrin
MDDYPTPLLDPAAIPQVALASMNQTHREEVELINRLGVLLAAGAQGKADAAAITATVSAWVVHTREHFQRENELMKSHGFPAYPIHRGEHDRVLSLIDRLQQAWLDRQQCEPLIEFIFSQWPQWFDDHVNSMDRVTAQFLASRS